MEWLLGFVAKLFARIFSDWRRDQEIKDKGRIEQENANLTESNKRRDEADKDKRQVARDGEDLSGDF